MEQALQQEAQGEIRNVKSLAFVANKMVSSQMQAFWLGQDIGMSLKATAPPSDIYIKDIPMPFEGFTVLLHHDLFKTPSDGSIISVSVGRDDKTMCMHAISLRDNSLPVEWWGNFSVEDSLTAAVDHSRFIPGEWFVSDDAPHSDSALIGDIFALFVNMCFYMVSTPEQVDKPTIEGRHKKNGAKIDWWHPRWVAKRYRLNRPETANSVHASPRMHWRRGHWRGQRFGEKRKEVKQVWIEPILVNKE